MMTTAAATTTTTMQIVFRKIHVTITQTIEIQFDFQF